MHTQMTGTNIALACTIYDDLCRLQNEKDLRLCEHLYPRLPGGGPATNLTNRDCIQQLDWHHLSGTA